MTDSILKDLETKINNNYFRSKSELISYINGIRNSSDIDMELFNSKIGNLLALYDSLVYNEELPIDLSNYKDVKLENDNYIVSSNDSVVLKNNGNVGELAQEFKNVQNDIIVANNNDSVGTEQLFKHMEKYQKEKSTLVSLTDLNVSIIDKEVLDKIRFFLGNSNINLYDYKVDISNGVFFNVNTNELFEVRSDRKTGKFEIFKGSEATYNSETYVDKDGNEFAMTDDLASLTDEELVNYEQRTDIDENKKNQIRMALEQRRNLNRPKTRILRLSPMRGKDAAFINYNLLLVVIITSSIMIASLLLLLK